MLDMMVWDIMGEKGFRALLRDAYFEGSHRDHAVRAFEVRVPKEGPESLLAHDVPHHHVEHRGRALPCHIDGPLRDLGSDRRDVSVVEFILYEPPDQRGLADRDVSDQAHLRLHVLQAGQGGRRHHAAPKRTPSYVGYGREYRP